MAPNIPRVLSRYLLLLLVRIEAKPEAERALINEAFEKALAALTADDRAELAKLTSMLSASLAVASASRIGDA
jgi:uncharacterized protein YegL